MVKEDGVSFVGNTLMEPRGEDSSFSQLTQGSEGVLYHTHDSSIRIR